MHPTDESSISLKTQRWRYVGGAYTTTVNGTFLDGAMYVETFEPFDASGSQVVMIHGGCQTGTNFVATPDGRRGWLHDFLRAGFTVHIIDQPERARSGHQLHGDYPNALIRFSVEHIEDRFTATAVSKLWPQAAHHSQWPGTGQRGALYFDQFFASQVAMLRDRGDIEALTADAGAALLDEIGPATLLTHSQSGAIGWLMADRRPALVSAILAIEPNGPPFREVDFSGDSEPWYRYRESVERPYGITRAPLTYSPALTKPSDLRPALAPSGGDATLVDAMLQSDPPRQLVNLSGLPILIACAEASYHATYDHCTSAFLTQAGVEHDFVYLAEHGLKGNGHMVMLEKNNHAVADFLLRWLKDRGIGSS
ncbi:MAG: alpha/beta hydrolase [Pseudomonadota bacterium]